MSTRCKVSFGSRELASLEALLYMEILNAEPVGKAGHAHMRRVKAMHRKVLLALQSINAPTLGVNHE